ncbi:MAG TPA: 50S ribosomal protein L25/general stress protein Ctc [Actinomycetes bacterium]|jgi:large subunit ribosomal protein L25|nr:50S ribosomal protein L25/general stress protein Ctc [Actinomycetes bacterium]
MSEYKLAAENRADAGKGAARRLRAAGRVPAVLYGHGTKPRSLSVDAREFGHALRTDAGTNVLLELEVGRTRHLALAKEIQRHPVRGTFIHVDFIVVRRGEKVQVTVPVHLVGEAPGVREGGIADQDLYQVHVEAEVTAVPDVVEADVSGLGIGDVLRVGELKAPEGATILEDPEASVVSVVPPVVEPEPEEAEEAEAEAAEGEAPAAEAEGEAPAAEGEDRAGS